MVIPLPALSDDSFTGPAQPISVGESVRVSTSPSPHLDCSNEEVRSNDVFILKELDKVSKRKATKADLDNDVVRSLTTTGTRSGTGELDANANYSPLGKHQNGASEAREEAKARLREEKRQKRALRKEEADGGNPTEPFDYANADSVLHVKSDREKRNGSAAARQEFNPYSKALDGPQGLKRVRKETAGRSFTFKK